MFEVILTDQRIDYLWTSVNTFIYHLVYIIYRLSDLEKSSIILFCNIDMSLTVTCQPTV